MPLRLSLSALAMLALAAIAFWPGYLSKFASADRYVHAHAALGTCWLLLLAVQPLLINASFRSAHRLLGGVGIIVGVCFFVSGILIAHRSVARMGVDQFAREGRFVYLPLATASIFAVALLLAVVWRHTPAMHGRFMSATALPLIDPLVARLLFFYAPPLPAEALYQAPAFALSAALLVAMLVSLPPESRGRSTFLYFSLVVIVLLLSFFVVPHTSPWLALTAWFRALPMT